MTTRNEGEETNRTCDTTLPPLALNVEDLKDWVIRTDTDVVIMSKGGSGGTWVYMPYADGEEQGVHLRFGFKRDSSPLKE